jgi:pimeloyl-ACP methyl ester carboxylesterase
MPYAKNGDLDIYYELFGEGEPLVLIMGLGADGPVWEAHREFYKEKFLCIVIDNRGVGKSSKPLGPYSSADMATDVVAVLDELGVKKTRVAGISMGGIIAQSLVLNHPERVISQVLISTWAVCDDYAKAVFENMKSHRMHVKPGQFMEYLQILIFATKFFGEQQSMLKEGQQAADENPAPQPQFAFDAQCDACTGHDTVSRLSEIKVPTLITVGTRDIFTPVAFSKLLHENIEGSKYIEYPDTGHAHHWEVLEQFNNDTREFLLATGEKQASS